MPEAGEKALVPGEYSDELNNYLNVLRNMSLNTDDFLYIADLRNDANWFVGDIEKKYTLRDFGREYNTLSEVLENVYPPDRKAIADDIEKVSRGEQDSHNMEYRWMTREGEPVWVSCRGNVIKDGNGNSRYMIGRVSEVTMLRYYNPLTGLGNKLKMKKYMKY